MNKIRSKYWYIFTTVIAFSGLLNSGCFQLERFSFGRSNRINALEEKVESLSNSMGSLTTENYGLKKNISELEAVKNQLNEEYTQIKNKQIDIETAQTTQSTARNRMEEEMAETKHLLEAIERKLNVVESDKNILAVRLKKLEVSRVKTIKTEAVTVKAKDAEKTKSNIDRSRELIKETQEKRKSSLVEELLDKAIQLYRQEKFEDAISKWEEVLALDPSKLEAKFNIEIAQDRIKEKQIQEDLKSSRTQRR